MTDVPKLEVDARAWLRAAAGGGPNPPLHVGTMVRIEALWIGDDDRAAVVVIDDSPRRGQVSVVCIGRLQMTEPAKGDA